MFSFREFVESKKQHPVNPKIGQWFSSIGKLKQELEDLNKLLNKNKNKPEEKKPEDKEEKKPEVKKSGRQLDIEKEKEKMVARKEKPKQEEKPEPEPKPEQKQKEEKPKPGDILRAKLKQIRSQKPLDNK